VRADINPNGPCTQRVVKEKMFWRLQDQQLTFVDIKLIEQMIRITKIPTPLIEYVEEADTCASICMTSIRDDTGQKYILPCIALWTKEWQGLSDDQKIFLLLHEAAHYVLGHLEVPTQKTIGAHIRDTCGERGFENVAVCSGGLMLWAGFAYIFPQEGKKAYKGWLGLTSLSAVIYLLCRQEYAASQQQEKDADILAVKHAGSAQGGIAYFKQRITSVQQSGVVDMILIDYGKLSTHPSDLARVAYLTAWQKSHRT